MQSSALQLTGWRVRDRSGDRLARHPAGAGYPGPVAGEPLLPDLLPAGRRRALRPGLGNTLPPRIQICKCLSQDRANLYF